MLNAKQNNIFSKSMLRATKVGILACFDYGKSVQERLSLLGF